MDLHVERIEIVGWLALPPKNTVLLTNSGGGMDVTVVGHPPPPRNTAEDKAYARAGTEGFFDVQHMGYIPSCAAFLGSNLRG